MSKTSDTVWLKVNDLNFDHKNPRLAEYGIEKKTPEADILKILWDTMDVQELVQSIAASGFFPHEALIVAKEEGKNIVIEGNRRLAAVKVLLHDRIAKDNKWDVPVIEKEAREQLQSLPVIISQRKESWRYLGFKHVNGPAKWSSYAKAAYIGDVHRLYKISLADIASQIGDRHNTVQRLYRGLMVLEQAEKEHVYDREDRFRPRLAFSHLYTGLDYDGIGSFLGVAPKEDETSSPVPRKKLKELGELCVWLYGSKKEGKPPVVESQNPDLRLLNAVVANRQAIAALRSGSDLSKAFEISRPAAAVFEEALLAAKRELTTAQAHMTTGYDKSDALLRIAGSVANIADDIYAQMELKKTPESKGPGLLKVDMFKLPDPPSAQAEINELADFAELMAWHEGFVSERAVQAALGREDENDNNVGCDDNDDRAAEGMDEVMNEVSRRAKACQNGYPFVLEHEGTVLRYLPNDEDTRAWVYRYLLLSTRMNMTEEKVHGDIDGTTLLEELSAHVLSNYLGLSRSRSMVFGTASQGAFKDKVNKLCRAVGEGGKFRNTGRGPLDANDDKLDAVAWVPFSDKLCSQLVIFGQCKTGSNWGGLITQLQPDAFIKNWMTKGFIYDPIRAFCVSEAYDRARWYHKSSYAGLFFDRCRLVDFCPDLDPELLYKIIVWCTTAKETVVIPRRENRINAA